jgi:hypothetical protein
MGQQDQSLACVPLVIVFCNGDTRGGNIARVLIAEQPQHITESALGCDETIVEVGPRNVPNEDFIPNYDGLPGLRRAQSPISIRPRSVVSTIPPCPRLSGPIADCLDLSISVSLSSPRADQRQVDVMSALIHRLVKCVRKLRDYASDLLYHRMRCQT